MDETCRHNDVHYEYRIRPYQRENSNTIPTSQCHYRLQDIFYRACGSTAQSSDSARTLELGKYNHFREAYVLDIDE